MEGKKFDTSVVSVKRAPTDRSTRSYFSGEPTCFKERSPFWFARTGRLVEIRLRPARDRRRVQLLTQCSASESCENGFGISVARLRSPVRAKLNLAGCASSFGRGCLRAPQALAKAELVKIGGSSLGMYPTPRARTRSMHHSISDPSCTPFVPRSSTSLWFVSPGFQAGTPRCPAPVPVGPPTRPVEPPSTA